MSPVIDRLPAMIWLMRLGGTSMARANAVGLTPNSSSSSLRTSPGCTARLNMSTAFTLMVVHDFDFGWAGVATGPVEADAPLPVDADRILPIPIAPECFQAVAGQPAQGVQGWGCVQDREPLGCLLLEPLECWDESSFGELFGPLVCVPEDHEGSTVRCDDVRQSYSRSPVMARPLVTPPTSVRAAAATAIGPRVAPDPSFLRRQEPRSPWPVTPAKAGVQVAEQATGEWGLAGASALRASRRDRQPAYRGAGVLLGGGEIELRLEVHPELRVDAGPVLEAESRVAGYRALPRDDLADAIGRDIDGARGCSRTDAQLVELVPQDLFWVCGASEHVHRRFSNGRGDPLTLSAAVAPPSPTSVRAPAATAEGARVAIPSFLRR